MTDLTKAFHCFLHDLIIANLEAYHFLISAIKLIHEYLSNRKQRIKVNDGYGSWKDMFYNALQRSIVGPLLNTYSWDLFYFLEDLHIASYTIKKSQSLEHYKHFHHCSLDGLITTLWKQIVIKMMFDDWQKWLMVCPLIPVKLKK